MKWAKHGAAFAPILLTAALAAVLTGRATALAQTAAPPAAEAVLPPAAGAAAPPASPAPSSGPIAALQQQLKREGYRPGPVNGVMTEETRRALTSYRRHTGRLPDALAAPGAMTRAMTAPDSGIADPVKRAQSDLQRLGLFAGPVDGVVGPRMRDAIIRFEVSQHLAIDPRVSDRLLVALEAAGAAGATTPPPAAASVPAGVSGAATPGTPTTEAPPEETGRRRLPPGVNPPPIR